MASHLAEVIEKLKQGSGLIAVQEANVDEYRRSFVQRDPTGVDPARPVLAWDADDGFRACSPYSDKPPEDLDLANALSFAKDHRGGVIFLFDCSGVDLAANERVLRKRLKEVADKTVTNPQLIVVLLVPTPISAALSSVVKWFGEPPRESTKEAAARPAAPA